MRTFTIKSVDSDQILDTIAVDDEGTVSYAVGDAEETINRIARLALDPSEQQIAEILDGWTNGYVIIEAAEGDQTASVMSHPHLHEFHPGHPDQSVHGRRGRGPGLPAIPDGPSGGKARPTPKPAAGKKSMPTTPGRDDLVNELKNVGTEDEQKVRDMLGALSTGELHEITRALDTVENVPKGASKQRKIDAIVRGTVGFRQRAKAMGAAWGTGQTARPIDVSAGDEAVRAVGEARRAREADALTRRIRQIDEAMNEVDGPARTKLDAVRKQLVKERSALGPAEVDTAQPARKRAPARRTARTGTPSALTKMPVDDLVGELEKVGPDDTDKILGALQGRSKEELATITLRMPTVANKTRRDSRVDMVDAIVEGTAGFRARARVQNPAGWDRPADREGAPVTSKMNAHSLTSGDRIMDGGKAWTVQGHQLTVGTDNKPVVVLEVVDDQGNRKRIVKGVNDPVSRVAGGRSGGAGTFALDDGQIAAVGDYDREHGIERDQAGRFGRGTRLGDLMQKVAGVDDDDEADTYTLANGRHYFDWSARDHNGDFQVDIEGESTPDDDDDDEDQDGESPLPEQEPENSIIRLHMSPKDMRNWATSIATLLLREKLLADPLDPDDPKTPLIASLLQTVPMTEISFGDDAWDQGLSFIPAYSTGSGYNMHGYDDDGDSTSIPMTSQELSQLHAQLVRQIIDMDQTASVAEFVSQMPEQLAEYWVHGPGAAKVRWCTRGSRRRARRLLLKEGVPAHMVDGAVTNLYVRACGHGPGARKEGMKMSSEGPKYVALAQFPTQNDSEMIAEGRPAGAPSTSDGWRGPLAPINIATGDRRKFASGALSTRQLPLPFRWQEKQEKGHDGAVVVGALTGYSVDPVTGMIKGEGYFLDEEIIPQVKMVKHLVEHGLIGPSVDLEPAMEVTYMDPDTGMAFNPHECANEGTCPTGGEAVITAATIAGATLVPITAFAEARAPEMFKRTVADDMNVLAGTPAVSQSAAVRFQGWDDLPFADGDHPWDAAAADARLTAWAIKDDDFEHEVGIDWDRYGRAFLWREDGIADTKAAFKFPVADIVDGRLTLIPHAIFNAAARVDSATLPSTAKNEIREVIEDLYDQMADEFDDEGMHAPWDRDHQMSSGAAADCGCAGKWANQIASAEAQFGVFGDMPPYPADAFTVDLDRLTPITITEDGRVFGHAASWKSCNRGYRGVCVPPPKNYSGYAQFHLGAVRTDQGVLPVGKIVQGEGHPDTGTGARIARAFYDRTSKTVAFVRAQDDRFGVKISGVLAPGVTPEDATMLLASPPSGDWKDGEMIAVLAVNVPGHVVPRATMLAGQPRNMVAAGRFWPEDHDEHAEHVLLETSFAVLDEALWVEEAVTLAASFTD